MEFRILGPLEARADGRTLPLGGPKQRAVLAQLLLQAGEVVSRDRLVEGLWTEPPETSAKAVQVHVSQLRKALAPHAEIRTRVPGYVLEAAGNDFDLARFERLRVEGRAALQAGDAAGASARLRDALALWHGRPLAEFAFEPFAAIESARLEEMRLGAVEDRIDADLALGRHPELVPELEALVAEHPLRERLRAQLLLALYRCGRQAAALESYREARRLLVDELGIEPGPALQRLERAILVQDPELELPARRPPPAPQAPEPPPAPVEPPPAPPLLAPVLPLEVRKTVTVVFCDVTGSTSLGEQRDAELMRRVLSRYFDEMRAALEGHGGTVEKFIGDAVMAVFGTPVLHEDDALRALRAAAEMRERLDRLNEELEASLGIRLEIRIGVNSGEVVAGDPTRRETFVTGDAVNIAQRLESYAAPGEILIGAPTYRLAREAVDVEPIEPVVLKGKREPLPAYRLLSVKGLGPPALRLRSPMVGRGRERVLLQDAFARAVQQEGCHLFTVLGPAGVGKSRLVHEALAEIGDRAQVLTGSCLPYGEGITFGPIAQFVEQAGGLGRVAELVGEADAELVAERVAEIVGRDEPQVDAAESFWAVRRLAEALARRRPLVAVFDDVNWAEPLLLDLIEHVADWARDAPILIVCMARPELLDARASWGGGMHNATTIFLEPLTASETDRLMRNLLGSGDLDEDVALRIRHAAGGNPLFVEELVALLLEEGLIDLDRGRWAATGDLRELPVPPSIQVLLASRLDLLGRDERQVLERAALEGQQFRRSAVEHLSDQSPSRVGECLQALVRKELVRRVDEDELRFRHLLIRDAAYDALPKQMRSQLHERLARWLDERETQEELVGYHLEQAVRYRAEVGRSDPALAAEAAGRLATAGRRAVARGDAPAAARLLERAHVLGGDGAPLLVDLAESLFRLGEFERADALHAEAIAAASAAGDRRTEVTARLSRARMRVFAGVEGGVDDLGAEIEAGLSVFEETGDDRAIARLLSRLAEVYSWRCQIAPMEDAVLRALEHARRAGDDPLIADLNIQLATAAVVGALPVADGRRRCVELLAATPDDTGAKGLLLVLCGLLAAMDGDVDQARTLCERGRFILSALGLAIGLAAVTTWTSAVELMAGDAEAAARELRAALEKLRAVGERGNVSSLAAQLAEALVAQGEYEEALAVAVASHEQAAGEDMHAQIVSRSAHAKAAAGLGRAAEAVATAREAIALAEATDSPVLVGDSLVALALALAAGGEPDEAVAAAEDGLSLYEAKGHAPAAAAVRTFIERQAEEHRASTTA